MCILMCLYFYFAIVLSGGYFLPSNLVHRSVLLPRYWYVTGNLICSTRYWESNFKNIYFVFKNYLTKGLLIKKSNSIKNDNSKIDLLKIKLNVNDLDTIIDLYGYKGLVSPKTYLSLNGLFISLSYGSINYSLPFAIKLKDFQLDRYPGSDSPSSFASEIEVIDKDKKFDYRIFMNNVLNYRGYRFFQSSYDNDEKGTILSVNKDRVGTFVTYSGYLSLLLSVIFVVISRFSRFNLLSKKLK